MTRLIRGMKFAVAVVAAGLLAGCAREEARAQTLSLDLPVACRLGETCEIQNYVDADPAPDRARDFQGGTRSYEGHNGVDIRLPTLAAQRAGVDVIAAAEGRVLRVRDGVADVSVKAEGAPSVEGKECGNGVVVEHEGGWETQYCHLAAGSIAVKPGEPVTRGQRLGRIGLSGETEYPHLHFTVRRGGQVVDPFVPTAGEDLWRETPPYRSRSVLNVGFNDGEVSMATIDEGRSPTLTTAAPALVAYARAIGLKTGDEQTLTLRGPGGQVVSENRAKPLANPQAQSMVFAGRRRPAGGWAVGAYTARYQVRSAGQVVLDRTFEIKLAN